MKKRNAGSIGGGESKNDVSAPFVCICIFTVLVGLFYYDRAYSSLNWQNSKLYPFLQKNVKQLQIFFAINPLLRTI